MELILQRFAKKANYTIGRLYIRLDEYVKVVVDGELVTKDKRYFCDTLEQTYRVFQKRVLLNASKAVVRQLDNREDYKLLHPVYCLNLVNDIGFESAPDEFYHDYAIVNVEHSDRIIEGLRFVYIELPKFQPKSISERKMAVLWLRFLTEISEDTKEAAAELLENEDTSKALSIVEKSAMSEGQLYAYEKFWSAVINEEALIQGSYKKGIKEERQKNLKEKLSSARVLKENGVPLDVISKSLNMTEEDLVEL